MTPTDFARHLTRFLGEYLPAQRNVSPNTVASYRDVFTLLLRYCRERQGIPPDRLRLDQLHAPVILTFLSHLETERHCTSRTRNQRLAAIHAFFRYLQSEAPDRLVQCQQILAIPFHRHERKPIPYLEAEDLTVLLAQPDRTTAEGRRHAVLIGVLYDTGARVQEVVNLSVGDVRLEAPAQIRLTGKGRKMRIVPLMPKTVALIEEYLREHRLLGADRLDEPLFFNRCGQRLSRSGVRYLIVKYGQQARQQRPSLPDKISPHTLRHTKAMHLLQAGNPLTVIQAILGHTHVQTCTIYASADLEMKRQALEKAAPMTPTPASPSWRSNQQLMDWLGCELAGARFSRRVRMSFDCICRMSGVQESLVLVNRGVLPENVGSDETTTQERTPEWASILQRMRTDQHQQQRTTQPKDRSIRHSTGCVLNS